MYFIAILSLLHAYIGWRLVPDLGAAPVQVAGAAVVIGSLGTMLLAILARGRLPRLQAARFAGPGLFMAGFFFLVVGFTLLRGLVPLAGAPSPSPPAGNKLRA